MSGAAAALAIGARRRRLLNRFRAAGAQDPATARTLSELGIVESRSFQRQCALGVLIQVGSERWFLDETAARREASRRIRSFSWLFLGLLVVVAAIWASSCALRALPPG